jgi:hypothetical protein
MIPPEIAFQIIDWLGEDDHAPLQSTSLVCRAWQYHSQRLLFRLLRLTVFPEGTTIPRLEGLGSPSAERIRQYVDGLIVRNTENVNRETEAWLDLHEELLTQVLRMLPLPKLTRFVLGGEWAKHDVVKNTLVALSPGILQCIQEICAGPMLRTLGIIGTVPFLAVLPCCGPSLKELYISSLPPEMAPQELSPHGRRVPIALEVLGICESGLAVFPNHTISLDRYILDPRALISLKFLRRLDIAGNHIFNETLSNVFAECAASLEELAVYFYSE